MVADAAACHLYVFMYSEVRVLFLIRILLYCVHNFEMFERLPSTAGIR